MQPPTTAMVLTLVSGLLFSAITVPTHADDCNGNGISDECDIDCGPPGDPCDVAGC